MRRLLVICTVLFLISSGSAVEEIDPGAVHKIVLAELAAMRLPVNSFVCIAILPARSTSETGADPSPRLLEFLARKGMRPRKASTCYNPPPKGNVIAIEVVKEGAGGLATKVTFTDVTLTAERDLGILHRRGLYELVRDATDGWVIQSYESESHK